MASAAVEMNRFDAVGVGHGEYAAVEVPVASRAADDAASQVGGVDVQQSSAHVQALQLAVVRELVEDVLLCERLLERVHMARGRVVGIRFGGFERAGVTVGRRLLRRLEGRVRLVRRVRGSGFLGVGFRAVRLLGSIGRGR